MGGAKKAKPPPAPIPTAIVQPISPEVAAKAEDRRKKMLAAYGRRGTILAGLGQVGTLGEVV